MRGTERSVNIFLMKMGTACRSDEVMLAKRQGEAIGYAFTITTAEGYGGDIRFAMGIQGVEP